MLFALTDKSLLIEVPHLRAALAWVRYARESAKFIFNNASEELAVAQTSDAAAKILVFLRGHGEATRTQIMSQCFRGHMPGKMLDAALDELISTTPPQILVREGPTAGNGRRPKSYVVRELSEVGEVNGKSGTYASSQACEVGEVGPATPQSEFASSPSSHSAAAAQPVENTLNSPDSPSSQAVIKVRV